jgi:hypothetical protein
LFRPRGRPCGCAPVAPSFARHFFANGVSRGRRPFELTRLTSLNTVHDFQVEPSLLRALADRGAAAVGLPHNNIFSQIFFQVFGQKVFIRGK